MAGRHPLEVAIGVRISGGKQTDAPLWEKRDSVRAHPELITGNMEDRTQLGILLGQPGIIGPC